MDIIAFKTLDVIDPIISSSRSDSGNNFDTAHGRFQKIEKNNVLVLELDNKGILAKKKLYNLDDMNDYKFVEKATQKDFSQNSFVYGVLSSLRDKINAPVRKRKEK